MASLIKYIECLNTTMEAISCTANISLDQNLVDMATPHSGTQYRPVVYTRLVIQYTCRVSRTVDDETVVLYRRASNCSAGHTAVVPHIGLHSWADGEVAHCVEEV